MRAFRSRLVLAATVLGVVLGIPSIVMAQPTGGADAGLVVTGFGEASAPANSVVVALTVSSELMMMGPVPSLPAGQTADDLVGPIVDALVEEDVDAATISVISGPDVMGAMSVFGPALAVIRFELSDPTADSLAATIDAATAAATDNRLHIGGMTKRFQSDQCDALQREAREAAIADGREQAAIMAELTGVSAGELTGVRDIPIGIESAPVYGVPISSSGCLPFEASLFLPESYGATVTDPNEEPMVTAYARVELTFATGDSAAATPAG